MKCIRRGRVGALLSLRGAVLGAAVSAGAANVWAGITFDATNSTVTITHDADITSGTDPLYIVRPKVVAANTIFPASAQQINHTFGNTDGSPNSIAVGSIGQTTNATTASFILSTGTGVSQDDPGNAAYPGNSSLRFDVDLWWNVTSPGFGPLANGYASLAVGGVVGVGGAANAHVHLEWKNANGTPLRTLFDETHNYTAGTSFTDSFTTAKALNGISASLPTNSKLHLLGFIEFQANNDFSPSSMR